LIDKKRVLIIAPHYNSFIKDFTEAMAKEVGRIYVLVRHNYLSELAHYLPFPYFRNVEKYSKRNLVDLKNKPDNVDVHVLSTLYFIPDGRNWGLGDKLFEKFRDHIKKEKIEFDLIHAHFTWPSGYVGVKLAKEFSVPVITTAHGYDVYDLPFRSEKWFKLVKSALEFSDHIITVSKSNFEILTQKLYIPEEKISLIPNGFNSELFRPVSQKEARKTLGIPFDRKILLNVANLVPVKGQRFLIEAMKEVVESRKDVLLLIVGGGPLIKDLKEQIAKAKLENYVKLVGPKPHDEIPLWMNAADLFVLSSLSEGNPTVMFEALGVGLPFVGTKVGGVPEIIISEDYGLLCEPANPKDLAEKILIALEKEWDREKIRKYAEQFTWENIAKRTLEVYRGVLK